ncbi:MAG TPA: AraC family transcriptional regulator [Fimbriimonadaceae bacterium]|nr:AraC family transcriptional regulator [Fimbriimonadaceae bacterium]
MPGLQLNPTAPDLWLGHAVLNGRSAHHRVEPMEGTLSIKTVLSGRGVWETPDGRYEVTPDTFLVLNQGQSYGLEIDSPTETLCLFLRPGFLSEGFYERLRLLTPELKAVLDQLRVLARQGGTDTERDEAILRAATLLRREESGPEEEARLDHASAAAREEVFRSLNRARDYALGNLGARLALDDLAAVACMSSFYFHRLHRQAFGETPHRFVTRARLAQAKRLLRAGTDVDAVSVALGFESLPTFTRLFKAHTGLTPGAFRKIG